MAGKRKYVAGKSTKDLLKMDADSFLKLSKPELREVVSRLADAANKRLKRLHYPTPAAEEVKRSGGKFSTKGKNLNQLRGEFIRIKNFMGDPTSTNKGMEEFIQEVKDRLKQDTGIEITTPEFFDFWDIYKKAYHEFPAMMREKRYKYETWRTIHETIGEFAGQAWTKDEVILKIDENLHNLYEKYKKEHGKSRGVSDYF